MMDLTRAERRAVRRAVEAYREAKRKHKGPFTGVTADEILEELAPTPVRWTELAGLVIDTVEGPGRGSPKLEPSSVRR